jgi:hypothetical protein
MLFYPAGTKNGFIDYVRSVCGCNHEDHSAVVHPVELVQQSIHHSLGDLVALVLPLWSQSVELVEKDNAGSRHPSPFEDLPHCLLTFPNVFGQQLRTLDGDEVSVSFVGDGLGNHRFSAARRTIEQDSSTADLEVHAFELFLFLQRHDDLLCKFVFDILQGPDIFQLHIGNLGKTVFFQHGEDFFDGSPEVINID